MSPPSIKREWGGEYSPPGGATLPPTAANGINECCLVPVRDRSYYLAKIIFKGEPMCEFRHVHGEGKKWYLGTENYSEDLLNDVRGCGICRAACSKEVISLLDRASVPPARTSGRPE